MKLNQHDVSTPLWQKLEAHYTPTLAKLRARAENPELPEAQRTPLLWQIKFIKEFLEMAEPDKKKVVEQR
ncbi:MAG: hypothetical protein V4730_11760 [Pseudomonadota bacterium]